VGLMLQSQCAEPRKPSPGCDWPGSKPEWFFPHLRAGARFGCSETLASPRTGFGTPDPFPAPAVSGPIRDGGIRSWRPGASWGVSPPQAFFPSAAVSSCRAGLLMLTSRPSGPGRFANYQRILTVPFLIGTGTPQQLSRIAALVHSDLPSDQLSASPI